MRSTIVAFNGRDASRADRIRRPVAKREEQHHGDGDAVQVDTAPQRSPTYKSGRKDETHNKRL